MKRYTQLTQKQRYQISILLADRQRPAAIARLLGVPRSTISRELQRNRQEDGHYHPDRAQQKTLARRYGKPRIDAARWQQVERYLRLDWSPEQISLYLRAQGQPTVSHTRIYQYIRHDKRHGGDLHTHLRHPRPYRKRAGKTPRISNRIPIDARPAIVEARSRTGDWELDTIVGKNPRQAIVTLSERKSRLTLMAKLPFKGAEVLKEAVIRLLLPLKAHVHTLTSDNGMEFSRYEAIASQLEADYYFAHPYASWQRGLNENSNGLIRQYLPKGSDFDELSEERLAWMMDRLNHRPRKCLAMKTPYEVFFGEMDCCTSEFNPPVVVKKHYKLAIYGISP